MYDNLNVHNNSAYSPIKSFRVKNFNCVDEITIDMTESPIVCLIGGNECGKTSVLDSIAYTLYHSNPKGQKDNIRDNTSGWGTVMELEDGTEIVRKKTDKANHWKVTYSDGECWQTNKMDSGKGVPAEVQKVIGCISESETKEYLNVRTYRDLLMFITTGAGANYKLMYGALKAEHISKAIKKGTDKVSKLKAERDTKETIIQYTKTQIEDIRIYDTEALENVKERLEKREKVIELLETALDTKKQLDSDRKELGVIEKLDQYNLKEVDMETVGVLRNAQSTLIDLVENRKRNAKGKLLEGCREVNMEVLGAIRDAKDVMKDLVESRTNYCKYVGLENCKEISTEVVQGLSSAISLRENNEELKNRYLVTGQSSELSAISTAVLDELRSLDKLTMELEENRKAYERYKKVANSSGVDIRVLEMIQNALDMKENLDVAREKRKGLEEKCSKIEEDIIGMGVKTTVCSHCGELVIVV